MEGQAKVQGNNGSCRERRGTERGGGAFPLKARGAHAAEGSR